MNMKNKKLLRFLAIAIPENFILKGNLIIKMASHARKYFYETGYIECVCVEDGLNM